MAEKIADIAKISYVQKLQILQKLYLKNYKKLMRDKIPEIGKMSPEELQGADLCSKIINVRKIEHRKNCELLKIANVAKINNMQNAQMHDLQQDFER